MMFEHGGSTCTSFARALPVCQTDFEKRERHSRVQINELSSFIDGSQIYGVDLAHSQRLRAFDGMFSFVCYDMMKLTRKQRSLKYLILMYIQLIPVLNNLCGLKKIDARLKT